MLALAATAGAPPSTRKPAASDAPSKAQCLRAYEQAQRLRKAAKLRETRQQLIVCSHEVCPAELRSDCGRWLTEAETDTPSIVFGAKGPDGRDAVDVRVSIDDQLVTEKLDGKAIELDPGQHRIRFEMKGRAPIEQDLLVREREKGRAVSVEFAADAPPARHRSRVLAYAAGGVGILGLGAFTYFGLHGRSLQSDLDDRQCKPRCPQSDVDAMDRSYLIANISLGVSIVSFAAATWLFLRPGPAAPPPSHARWSLTASAQPGAATAAVYGSF